MYFLRLLLWLPSTIVLFLLFLCLFNVFKEYILRISLLRKLEARYRPRKHFSSILLANTPTFRQEQLFLVLPRSFYLLFKGFPRI